MAADILLYNADAVPVGEDQKQHLELTRDIAQKFNNDFAARIAERTNRDGYFKLPEPLIQGPATRVMSLRDGSKKMSKSDPSDNSRINLTDDADTIAQKIRRAKTDPDALPSEAEGLRGRPEADNLVSIYAGLSGDTKDVVLQTHGGSQFSAFKAALSDLAVDKLSPIAIRDAPPQGRSRLYRRGVGQRRGTGPSHRGPNDARRPGDRRACWAETRADLVLTTQAIYAKLRA